MTIGLDGCKAFNASDTNTFINVELQGKEKLIPRSSIRETISKYEVYSSERNASTKYRFIFAVSPICSNVLFNKKTEVVINEGSDSCQAVFDDSSIKKPENAINSSTINLQQCIRDTEYSHPLIGNYSYKCGGDIFNNHLLRTNSFVFVNKIKSDDKHKDCYNTMCDYSRLENGSINKEDITVGQISAGTETERHIYDLNLIDSFNDTFNNKLIEKDGWFGFQNISTIDVANGEISANTENYKINKVMNNMNACDFVELYPDRTLFSFTPKYNTSRRRPEYNWDYVITYPYKNDFDMLNTVCDNEGTDAIKIISYEITHAATGTEIIRFKTMFKHNLSIGKYVNLYYKRGCSASTGEIVYDDITEYSTKLQVVAVGDADGEDKTRYFAIRVSDVDDILMIKENYVKVSEDETTGEAVLVKTGETLVSVLNNSYDHFKFYYRQNVNNVECNYYFRKFKTIKNTKYIESANTYIEYYPSSDVNKLAYADTIYGDGMSQIVYTDDIDTSGLIDNLGRGLNEVFLTVIKTNRGYQEWYNSGITNTDSVEYSHCFGKVTSGLDLPDECYDYNIHKLHNIDLSGICSNDEYKFTKNTFGDSFINDVTGKINNNPLYIEDFDDAIKNKSYDEFYGDIVEFDATKYTETIIEDVYHRVNTAQRETSNKEYFDIHYDDIQYDDFDVAVGNASTFTIDEGLLNKLKSIKVSGDTEGKLTAGNIAPEGYFYAPHHRIKIKEEDDSLLESDAEVINFSTSGLSYSGNLYDTYIDESGVERPVVDEYGEVYYYDEVKVKAPTNFGFVIGDMIAFYDSDLKKTLWGYLYEIENNTYLTIRFIGGTIDYEKLYNLDYKAMYVIDTSCPTYAAYVPVYSKFVWKKLLPLMSVGSDSELYDMPFANGRHYVEKNINVFLRRQDPEGEFYMMNYDEEEGVTATSESRRLRKRGLPKYDFRGMLNGIENNLNIC